MTVAYYEPSTVPWIFDKSDPEPPPPYPGNIVRFANDFENELWNYACRTLHPEWPNPNMRQAPQVIPLFLTANSIQSGNTTNISKWKGYIWEINGITSEDDPKWRYYTNSHSGWFNSGYPALETLAMGDNLAMVLETIKGFSRLHTLVLEDGPPDPNIVNGIDTPWLVHRFTVSTPGNNVIDPPPGRIYSPFVVSRRIYDIGKAVWADNRTLVNV